VTRALSAPAGPVSIEWPIDLQYAAAETGPIAIEMPLPRPPRHSVIAEAARLLARAKRPVIWAGGGAAGCGPALTELLNRTTAALFTSNAGRGVVGEDHELCVGNYATTTAGQALLDDADLLLSIGSHFRSNETHSYKLRLPANHIQIDIDPASLGRVYPVAVGIQADARLSVTALTEALDAVGATDAADVKWRARVTAARERVRLDQRRDIGSQSEICDAISEALPRSGIVARDVTIPASSWGNRLLPMFDPRSNIFARGGGIGQGLAMGIGAAIGRPDDPVVIMAGDGGLAVHLGELLTLAQESCRATLIVFNDRGYGVLRNMQDSLKHSRAGVDLHTPRFADLAAALGLDYARIDDSAQAKAVLANCVASAGPTLVEVDLVALGPMPKLFVPPVDVPVDRPQSVTQP
jgi:acetolactate synthase-1/2/3 large subunit